MLMVGPVAVLPERQQEGFGKAMTLALLDAIDRTAPSTGALPQVLIGDKDYYGRFFGFSSKHTGGWHCPGPFDRARLLARCSNPAVLPAEGMLGPWLVA
jgi:predicted N-acetyltransferase YhbS